VEEVESGGFTNQHYQIQRCTKKDEEKDLTKKEEDEEDLKR
jgi:hypothetical protein